MNTKLTGIISEGDTKDLKEWVEKLMGASAERTSEIVDLRDEVRLLRQSIEIMHKQVDAIERILTKVAE